MSREPTARPVLTWLALAALTLLSILLAEQTHLGGAAIVAMFVIAGTKGELVIAHYMEIGRALPHWRIAYRIWLVAVTLMLSIAHLIG